MTFLIGNSWSIYQHTIIQFMMEGFEISTENKSSYDTLDDMVEEGS